MKIEPCTCHFKYPEQYTVDANCWYFYCPRCGARGGFGTTVEQALHEWNRPARIVRAAEEYVDARQKDYGDYAYKGEGSFACGKYELLRIAVEGGAE